MSDHEAFTERELDIMRLMVDDLDNRDIASRLSLSIKTVRWYLRQIYSKLAVHSRDDALAHMAALNLFVATNGAHQEQLHNLPAQVTAFVGRESELGEIARLMADPACRLLSLVGPGGMGKTSLAIEAARFQRRNFADGVYFVPFAPVSSANDIVPAIADALDYPLREDARPPQQQLVAYLREKNLLLIIDNFEHLLDDATILTELLQSAPHLQMIATTRERLNSLAETVVNLGGMAMPEADTLEDMLRSSAVKLFVQSAQRVQPGFALQAEDMDSIAQICQQVGGMPLGILLAAAWITMLTPQEIVDEIERSLDILGHDIRDLPPRQQRISAVFESSWGRMSADEQQVFVRLSVFRDGFSREAARQVAEASLPHLNGLVNKSMLQIDPHTRRWSVHELLRQYGAERLATGGETEATGAAHCHYFMDFMQQRVPDLKGGRQIEAYDEIEADFDNIRAGWYWAVERKDYALLEQAIEGLDLINGDYVRGSGSRGLLRRAYEYLTPYQGEMPHPVWCHLCMSSARHYEMDMKQVEMCLAVAQAQANDAAIARCLWGMRSVVFLQGAGAYEEANRLAQKCLTLYRQLDEPFYAAQALWELTMVHNLQGRFDEGDTYLEECLRLRREIEDEVGTAWCLFAKHMRPLAEGRYQEAEDHLRAGLARHYEMRNLLGVSLCSVLLGRLAFLKGDVQAAQALADDSLQIYDDLNQHFNRAWPLAVLALVACLANEYDRALSLCEESIAVDSSYSRPTALWGQAMAFCGTSDYTAARQALLSVLNDSHDMGDTGLLTWCLPVAAMIAAHEGDKEHATELLGLAFTHPASATGWMEQWALLTQLREDLQDELGAKRYELAWQRGQGLDLDTTVNSLLAEDG